MTIETKYDLGESVKIIAHQIDGVINGFWVQRGFKVLYNVEYIANELVVDRNFSEEEITSFDSIKLYPKKEK